MSYQQFVKLHMAMEHIKQLPQKERMAKIGAMWRAQKQDLVNPARKPNKTVKTVKAKKQDLVNPARKHNKGGAISGGAISGGNIDANIGADSDIELEPEMVGGGFFDDLLSMNPLYNLVSGGALVKSAKASPSKQLNALLTGNATHSGGYQQFNLPALKPITVSIKQQLINKR